MDWTSALDDVQAIETERLRLRKLRLEDAPAMFEYLSLPDVTRFIPWVTNVSVADTEALIEQMLASSSAGTSVPFGIALKSTGEFVGNCTLMLENAQSARAEVAYLINPLYRGQGFAAEALRAMLNFGFNRLGMNRIAALASPEHTASIRVMEKVGMKHDGILRQYKSFKGQYNDTSVYSMLRGEWNG